MHQTTEVTTNAEKRPGPNNARNVEQAFVAEIQRRFRKLRGLVRATVSYENDALNLSTNADPRERFSFESRQELTFKFVQWLRDTINDELLEPVSPVGAQEGQHWTSQFIRQAYIQGVNQGTGLLLQQGVSIDNIPDDEIPTRPIHAQTLRDLYQRVYSNLESITDDMVPQVRETLTEGFAEGHNPRKMARELTSEIRDLQRNRAETLARTETINSHAQASLRQYRQAGVNVVNHVKWNTANDDRVCPFCETLEGVAISLDEAENAAVSWSEQPDWKNQTWRLAPPAHPQCRCVMRPAVGADELTTPLSERIQEKFSRATVLQ